MGIFRLEGRFYHFYQTQITYGSDTSGRKLGNGERDQTPWKGELTLSRLGECGLPPERIERSLLGVPLRASPI